MHRDGPLKNIFKEDNWKELGKASTHMYTRKAEEAEFNPEEYEKSKHAEAHEQKPESEKNHESPSNNPDIERALAKLKAEKDAEVNQIIQKINDLISRQNRLETALEDKDAKIRELSQQIELYLKKPAPEALVVEKKEPHDKPIDRTGVAPSDVTIEKMFNFSNKKF